MLRVALSGGNLQKFELTYDSVDLIGVIFQQLKRVKIEKYEPVVISGKTEHKPTDASIEKQPVTFTSMIID